MVPQQKLGLWPQRRAWIDRGNPASPAIDESLLIAKAGNVENKPTSRAGNQNLGGLFFGTFEKVLIYEDFIRCDPSTTGRPRLFGVLPGLVPYYYTQHESTVQR
jgi:hypothetical protein